MSRGLRQWSFSHCKTGQPINSETIVQVAFCSWKQWRGLGSAICRRGLILHLLQESLGRRPACRRDHLRLFPWRLHGVHWGSQNGKSHEPTTPISPTCGTSHRCDNCKLGTTMERGEGQVQPDLRVSTSYASSWWSVQANYQALG